MSVSDLQQLILSDNRDREKLQCLNKCVVYHNLVALLAVKKGFCMIKQNSNVVQATYSVVRLFDLLFKQHQQDTLNYVATNALNIGRIITEFFEDKFTIMSEISHIFEIASNYKLFVLSPIDYVFIILRSWKNKTLKCKISKSMIYEIRVICLYLVMHPKFYAYHPSTVAISILHILGIFPKDFPTHLKDFSSSYDNISVQEIAACRNDIITATKSFVKYSNEYSNDTNILNVAVMNSLTGISNVPLYSKPISPQKTVCANYSDYKLIDDGLFYETLRYYGELISESSHSSVRKLHEDNRYVSKTFYDLDDCFKEYALSQHFKCNHVLSSITYANYEAEDENDDSENYDDENIVTNHCIIYPRADSSLEKYADLLRKNGKKIQARLMMIYVYQLVAAIKYFHDQYLIHGSITASNILLHDNGILKVCGFSKTTMVRYSDTADIDALHVDIKGLGNVLFYMLTGTRLFGENVSELIQNLDYDLGSRTSLLKEFIAYLIMFDNVSPITIKDVMMHPFYMQCKITASRE